MRGVRTRWRLVVLGALLAVAVTGGAHASRPTPVGACAAPRAGAAYTRGVERALRAGADVWGNALLAAPGGPTYAGARARLQPLLYARTSGGRPLTESGVYYLPFAQPLGPQGAGSVQLHVADGSQILAGRVGGRSLRVGVGAGGRERFGSCLARLAPARLADGWLPVLQTRYVDGAGVRYAQESFAARSGNGPLTSWIRVDAVARGRAATLRLEPLAFRTAAHASRTVFVAWSGGRPRVVDGSTYAAAKDGVRTYWTARLAEGATFDVPEARVMNAERSLLTQNLALTWRYSIGNPYEEFSFPESLDGVQVLAEYGYTAVARSMLRVSLSRRPEPYANWKRGEKLLASAVHVRLSNDAVYLAQATPALRSYVAAFERQLGADGLLARERYSSDIPDSVLGLHAQAVAWQGLRAIASVWSAHGHPVDAARAARTAARLEAGLRSAVRRSQRRLPDGSLFLPVRLLDREPAYSALTASRDGSYWNLVAPYAFASGLFAPTSAEARGAHRYLLRHGSRLLGLVRAGAFALYGNTRASPQSGTDEVYGVNVAHFLADLDEPDQLVLGLYGVLAAGMTENTFVSGEGATVAPLHGLRYRAMYLPPSSVSNDAFLETLRLLLVHETRDARGEPRGLELAFATPRAWLASGKRIQVRAAPTSFGPLTYSLESRPGAVHATVGVPAGTPARTLKLRLRLPRGQRITSVTLDGAAFTRFNAHSETIDLHGLKGTLMLEVRHT